jgi:uncharacterized membrane protein
VEWSYGERDGEKCGGGSRDRHLATLAKKDVSNRVEMGMGARGVRRFILRAMTASVHPSEPRDGFLGLTYRQVIAIVALVNAFVATYLHLWKIGKAGNLACGGSGGCAVVQFSQWSWFLGVDVALIGAVGYTIVLGVAIVGTSESRADSRRIALVLAGLIWAAFLFTLRLKYAELIILRTFCPWCAISAVSITVLSVIAALELRRAVVQTSPSR